MSATRRAVVEAARELFVRQGWTATSVEHVAAAAGVSRATVFTVGGKSELLKLAYDTAIGGDDEDVAMADRPAVRALSAAPDLDALVARYVELVVATDVAGRQASTWRCGRRPTRTTGCGPSSPRSRRSG